MSDSFKWWSDPKKTEDVEAYVELLFTHAGQNLWTKLLKPYVAESITKKISEKSDEKKQ
ncbi:hypothetical protein K1X76_05295 [bacterium]|nr:hypothetical protein [bacterium]